MKTGQKKHSGVSPCGYPFGKTTVESSVRVETVGDLTLAYSPGVAQPCLAIAKNPHDVYRFTGKGNLVAIISDVSSNLHLGNQGSLASKPVMEGKALLFRRLAKINAVDIQVNTSESATFIDTVTRITDTFGDIHLESMAESKSLEIEQALDRGLDSRDCQFRTLKWINQLPGLALRLPRGLGRQSPTDK